MTTPIWTIHAQRNVASIYEFIAQDSAIYAHRMVDRIEQASLSAARQPESGGIVPEFDLRHIREVIAGNYRVIYRLFESGQIEILAVIHGARRLPFQLDDHTDSQQ